MSSENTRRYRNRRYREIEQMPKIPCACGCGTLIAPFTKKLKPAQYAHGHNPGGEVTRFKPGQESPWKGKPNPILAKVSRERPRSKEEIEKRTATRRANNGGRYTRPDARGWSLSEQMRTKMTEIAKRRVGSKNPFYGKTHSPQTRAILSRKSSGSNNAAWRGGVAVLPYGPEFTRKFKHLIRQRDNYTCRRCGRTQEQEGRTLEVHHLDHNKLNSDPDNLVASCHACNVWASYHRDEPFLPA